MRNEIPALDYPSRSAAVRALQSEGRSYKQIAEAVGVDNAFVHAVMNKAEPSARRAPPHRAKVDPNHIVRGVLPKGVAPSRQPLPASDKMRGRTIQAMTQPRYRLQRADGLYLRLDAGGFVEGTANSWIGFARQLRRLTQLHPEFGGLAVVTVLPPSRGAFNPTATR